MSYELTIGSEFSATRYSKAGKATTRGALGVITSGNRDERAKLAGTAIGAMLANSNFRHVMREMDRVFPASFIKHAPNVSVAKIEDDYVVHFIEDAELDGRAVQVLERYEGWTKANKHVFANFARAVVNIATNPEKADKVKGEKLMYVNLLRDWLQAEAARVAALEAELAQEIEALEASVQA